MATLAGVITDLGREKYAKYTGSLLTFAAGAGFKVGEGGWIDPGSGRIPRTPDSTLTDLDCKVNPGRYPNPDDRAYYPAAVPPPDIGKAFVPADISFVAPSTIRLRCRLEAVEFNDDGFGNSPEIWELGVFDSDGDMLAYFTFPKQIKTPIVLENYVNLTF